MMSYSSLSYRGRRVMKKLLVLLFSAFLVVSLSACAASSPPQGAKDECHKAYWECGEPGPMFGH